MRLYNNRANIGQVYQDDATIHGDYKGQYGSRQIRFVDEEGNLKGGKQAIIGHDRAKDMFYRNLRLTQSEANALSVYRYLKRICG